MEFIIIDPVLIRVSSWGVLSTVMGKRHLPMVIVTRECTKTDDPMAEVDTIGEMGVIMRGSSMKATGRERVSFASKTVHFTQVTSWLP